MVKKLYAPGQRVIIRDTEWVIRRVDLGSRGLGVGVW